MPRLTELAHLIVGHVVRSGDLVIDATIGNGHDTSFLRTCVGPTGAVYGLDIQPQALVATRARLGCAPNVHLFQHDHAHLRDVVPPGAHGRIAAVMFNLGYLPGSDKKITTGPTGTCQALNQACDLLRPGGVLTVMVYPAHPGGAEEAQAVMAQASQPSATWNVTRHHKLGGQRPGPELLVFTRTTRD